MLQHSADNLPFNLAHKLVDAPIEEARKGKSKRNGKRLRNTNETIVCEAPFLIDLSPIEVDNVMDQEQINHQLENHISTSELTLLARSKAEAPVASSALNQKKQPVQIVNISVDDDSHHVVATAPSKGRSISKTKAKNMGLSDGPKQKKPKSSPPNPSNRTQSTAHDHISHEGIFKVVPPHSDDHVIFILRPVKPTTAQKKSSHIQALQRPAIRCSGDITARHIAIVVRKQLALNDSQHVSLFCAGVPIGTETTLSMIQISLWADKKGCLIIDYKLSDH